MFNLENIRNLFTGANKKPPLEDLSKPGDPRLEKMRQSPVTNGEKGENPEKMKQNM